MFMNTLGLLGAWLAIGLWWIWAGIWEALIASSAMNASLRNPDMKSKFMIYMILFIALDETVAIYGLIIAFKILGMDIEAVADPHSLLSAWLAVWLPWLAVWIWEWLVARASVENMWKNPELITWFMTLTILWMALVESAAIYWLIVAFRLLG